MENNLPNTDEDDFEDLAPIFEGFKRLSLEEKTEYIKYWSLFLTKNDNKTERRWLHNFKAKLEKEIENYAVKNL